MEQTVVISQSQRDIDSFLDKGWRVVSVTAQHVAIAPASNYTSNTKEIYGNFCFVLERESR